MKLNEKAMLIENIKIKQNEIDLLKLELSQKEKAITFLNENLRIESNLKEKYKSINQINLNAYESLRAIIDNYDSLQLKNHNLIAENDYLKRQKEYKWVDNRIDLKKENCMSTEYSEYWGK